MHIHIQIHMHMHVQINIHIHTHMHIHTHTHTHTHIYIYTYIHTHTHIHIYTHTHTHTPNSKNIGAIVTRIAETFLRFGSFELPIARQKRDKLIELLQFTMQMYYKDELSVSTDSNATAKQMIVVMNEYMHIYKTYIQTNKYKYTIHTY